MVTTVKIEWVNPCGPANELDLPQDEETLRANIARMQAAIGKIEAEKKAAEMVRRNIPTEPGYYLHDASGFGSWVLRRVYMDYFNRLRYDDEKYTKIAVGSSHGRWSNQVEFSKEAQ